MTVLLMLIAGCIITGICHQPAWALDESELTPTSKKIVAAEDAEFNDAMKVWNSHKYHDGEKLLRKFAEKYPDSRWAAEAELHVGCGLVYKKQFNEARSIFEKVV